MSIDVQDGRVTDVVEEYTRVEDAPVGFLSRVLQAPNTVSILAAQTYTHSVPSKSDT